MRGDRKEPRLHVQPPEGHTIDDVRDAMGQLPYTITDLYGTTVELGLELLNDVIGSPT